MASDKKECEGEEEDSSRGSDELKAAVSFLSLVKSSPTLPESHKANTFSLSQVIALGLIYSCWFWRKWKWEVPVKFWRVRIKSFWQTFKWIRDKSPCDEWKWWDFTGNWLDWLEESQRSTKWERQNICGADSSMRGIKDIPSSFQQDGSQKDKEPGKTARYLGGSNKLHILRSLCLNPFLFTLMFFVSAPFSRHLWSRSPGIIQDLTIQICCTWMIKNETLTKMLMAACKLLTKDNCKCITMWMG